MNDRNYVPPPAAIDAEIGNVGCDYRVPWVQLAHADQAKVRKIGFAVSVARGKFGQPFDMIIQHKRGADELIADERQGDGAAADVKCRLGQYRFASQEGLCDARSDAERPFVMRIMPVPERDQKTGVRDGPHLRE